MAGEPFDGTALSACIPALKSQDHRNSQAVDLAVQKPRRFWSRSISFLYSSLSASLSDPHREHAVLIPLFLHRQVSPTLPASEPLSLSKGRLEAIRHKVMILSGGVILSVASMIDHGARSVSVF